MDPASCAMGALGLFGLFTTCMQCFEFIQYGRQFGADYESAVLKLDVSRLRLSRWAQSIGLNDDPKSQVQLEARLSRHEVEITKNLLGNIAEAFENVETLSKRYERTQRLLRYDAADPRLDVIDSEAEDALGARFKRMHLKVKQRIQSRQQSTSPLKKARWALYERKRFDDLVRDIKDHIDSLVQVFPSSMTMHRQLAKEEVNELAEDTQDRLMLKSISTETDSLLQQAVEYEIMVQDGQSFKDIKISGHARSFLGNDVAYGVKVKGNTYSNLVIDGNAVVHAGNVYRGRGQGQIEFGQKTRRSNTDLGPSTNLIRWR